MGVTDFGIGGARDKVCGAILAAGKPPAFGGGADSCLSGLGFAELAKRGTTATLSAGVPPASPLLCGIGGGGTAGRGLPAFARGAVD